MRSRILLIISGAASVCLYAGMLRLSREFNWGEGFADRPVLTYLALYAGLFILYALACRAIFRAKEDRKTFWTLIAFGMLFRAILIPANQIQEDDIYRYLWDGKVFAHGINPFAYAPSEVNDYKMFKIRDPDAFKKKYSERNDKELARLNELKWESDRALTVLERVNHPEVPTIYPPMAQYVFRGASHLGADSIAAMRIAFWVFDLMTLAFLVGLLTALGKNRNYCLVYFWSPLIIKETFNSTHLDIIGIAFLFGSIYFLVRSRETLATLFLAFSFLGKFYPIILFPLYLQRIALKDREEGKPFWRRPLGHVLLFAGIVVLLYLPFVSSGMKTFEGLKTYTVYWQSNDSVFALLVYLYDDVMGLQSGTDIPLAYDLPTFLAKITVALALMGTLVFLMIRRMRTTVETEIHSLFILMALVFLLSPVQNPWYLCWVVPFLCLFPKRSWILLTWLVGWYYLDFYFDYQEVPQYSAWIPWFEYPPFYALLFLELWKNRRTRTVPGTL